MFAQEHKAAAKSDKSIHHAPDCECESEPEDEEEEEEEEEELVEESDLETMSLGAHSEDEKPSSPKRPAPKKRKAIPVAIAKKRKVIQMEEEKEKAEKPVEEVKNHENKITSNKEEKKKNGAQVSPLLPTLALQPLLLTLVLGKSRFIVDLRVAASKSQYFDSILQARNQDATSPLYTGVVESVYSQDIKPFADQQTYRIFFQELKCLHESHINEQEVVYTPPILFHEPRLSRKLFPNSPEWPHTANLKVYAQEKSLLFLGRYYDAPIVYQNEDRLRKVNGVGEHWMRLIQLYVAAKQDFPAEQSVIEELKSLFILLRDVALKSFGQNMWCRARSWFGLAHPLSTSLWDSCSKDQIKPMELALERYICPEYRIGDLVFESERTVTKMYWIIDASFLFEFPTAFAEEKHFGRIRRRPSDRLQYFKDLTPEQRAKIKVVVK